MERPTIHYLNKAINDFFAARGMPQCVGALDGKHFFVMYDCS